MTLLLTLLRRYWLHLLVAGTTVLILGITHRWAWVHGGNAERAGCLAKENKALQQAIADNAKANEERRTAQKEVDRLANLPPKVKEVIRANPSGCSLPRPVADAARVQVDAVNEAIRKDAVR